MTMPLATDEIPRRTWTRDEYEHMAEVGIFRSDEHTELIEGEIINQMAPQMKPHIVALMIGHRELSDLFGREYFVATQIPVALGDDSEPEPDFVVVSGPARRYLDSKPGPRDIHLLVEISESSLAFDRGRKALLYARHGIADYWIVNLIDGCVEVRRGPDPEIGYRTIRIVKPGEQIEPLAVPGKSASASELLP